MAFALYDHVSADGTNDIVTWTKQLQPLQRGKLNAKLDMLSMHGPNLRPQTLTGTDAAGIQKLRVKGNVQLRPLLCEGPVEPGAEFTLLIGATEVGGKLTPKGVLGDATTRKQAVIADPATRRTVHVRTT